MPSGIQELPHHQQLTDRQGVVQATWKQWFLRAANILRAVSTSGATADRPTQDLFIGQVYFDTTLGLPIWLKSVRPSVWVDATGASA